MNYSLTSLLMHLVTLLEKKEKRCCNLTQCLQQYRDVKVFKICEVKKDAAMSKERSTPRAHEPTLLLQIGLSRASGKKYILQFIVKVLLSLFQLGVWSDWMYKTYQEKVIKTCCKFQSFMCEALDRCNNQMLRLLIDMLCPTVSLIFF